MNYFSEVIFWFCIGYWFYFRQSVQGEFIQAITDIALIIAAVLSLFRYYKLWNNAKTKNTSAKKK